MKRLAGVVAGVSVLGLVLAGRGGASASTRREPLALYPGNYFVVHLHPPAGGTITSSVENSVECGPAGSGASRCGPTIVPWKGSMTLEATPRPGHVFQGWTGDCSGDGPCVLDTTIFPTDKTVGAVFVPARRAASAATSR